MTSFVEHGQPRRLIFLRRPLNPVSPVRRDVDPIAGPHFHHFIVEPQPGRTLHQQNEFVLVLVVPEVRRRGMAFGDSMALFSSDANFYARLYCVYVLP